MGDVSDLELNLLGVFGSLPMAALVEKPTADGNGATDRPEALPESTCEPKGRIFLRRFQPA